MSIRPFVHYGARSVTEEAATIAPGGTPDHPRLRRADARRNIEAIVEAARLTLAENPRAAMQDIAQAAGLHRATLHRHFPTRDDLVDAVRTRTIDATVDALRRVLAEGEGEPIGQTLDRFIAAMLEVGDRFRLYRYTTWRDASVEERRKDLGDPIRELLAEAQRAGEVRRDVSADQLGSALGGLLWAALPLLAEGAMQRDEAAAFVRRMISAPTH